MPVVNFIGNKERLTTWIYKYFPRDASSLFDAFSGGGSVSYFFKTHRIQVISNDSMIGSSLISKALVENKNVTLTHSEISALTNPSEHKLKYFEDNYSEIKFFRDECIYLDKARTVIDNFENMYKQALAFTSVRRAMIRKMPYSRFNIPWKLIKMLRDEQLSYERWGRRRAYHNEPFEKHVFDGASLYNRAIFDNGKENLSLNMDVIDALDFVNDVDVVYFDPPYAGKMNDYKEFYGLFDEFVSLKPPIPFKSDFLNKNNIIKFLSKMFEHSKHIPFWIMSYNSRSYPSKEEILEILKRHGSVETVSMEHNYKLTNKENKRLDKEYLFLVSL